MLQLGNGCDGDNATNRRGFPDKTKASLAPGCCYSRTCVHRVHSFVLLGPDNFCTGLKSEDLRQITGTFQNAPEDIAVHIDESPKDYSQ